MTARAHKFLVLLASYNGQKFIADQLATILNQAGVDLRVIVRDDGSTDRTVEVVRTLAAKHSNVSLLDDGGGNCKSAARNFLLMLETVDFKDADFIAFADQDDLWLPDKLRRAADIMTAENVSGYSSDLTAFDDAGQRAPWVLRKIAKQKPLDHFFQGASAGCTYVMRREAAELTATWLRSVNLDPGFVFSHDWLIYAFFRNRDLGWFHDTAVQILYRQHTMNVHGSRQGWRDVARRMAMTRTLWYRQHVLWIAENLQLSLQEQELVRRLRRMGASDRIWLFFMGDKFRRSPKDALMLRIAILLGYF